MSVRVGDRVEITAGGFPWQGRTGTVRKIGHITHMTQVWCDEPDLLGRRLVRVFRGNLRKLA